VITEKTFICAASGPSLLRSDCELVAASGLPVIAVNNTWQQFSNLYALCAGDLAWWVQHYDAVPAKDFRRITASKSAKSRFPDLEYRRYCASRESFNSGAMAIEFAAEQGAETILLIGYDCSLKYGQHWHGTHSQTLRNPSQHSIDKWQSEFLRTREKWPHVDIINCSRYTELKCYQLKNLEKALESSLLARAQA